MDQQTINEEEWQNQSNWSGHSLARFYSSKKDSRLWVPKSNPKLGWTINFGHPYGCLTMIGMLAMIPIFLIVIINLIKISKTH